MAESVIQVLNPDFRFGTWYSLRRHYIDEFFLTHAGGIAPGSTLLDIGGHKVRKRGRFDISSFPVSVTDINLTVEKRPDVQGDAANLPFADRLFDVVICAEVLEHTPDPRPILSEAWRVLKPDGVLLATVPFLFRIHADPYDFGRYTDYYWRRTLTAVGFESVTVEKQGAYASVMFDMVRELVYHFQKEGRLSPCRSGLAERAIDILRGWAIRCDVQPGVYAHPFWGSYTTGFGIRATKPGKLGA